MAALSAREMRKYEWRPEVFIRKLHEKSPFELNNGRKVVIIAPEDAEKTLRDGSPGELTSMRFADENGEIYKLTDFRKSAEFGGKDPGASVAKEDMALRGFRDQLMDAKEKYGLASIPIRMGNRTYEVYDVVSTPGTPKSDFHCIDVNGKEIMWISHKDGTLARHFQQWGGTSPRREPMIANHPETQPFVREIKKLFPQGIPEKAPSYSRKIKDRRLRMLAVYGNKFGGQLGQQNVTFCCQGALKLVHKNKYFEITAHHVHLNGEDLHGDYEPVFLTRLSKDRGDHGVKGLRLFIAPQGTRKAIAI